jgi:hypothetical protein
MMYSTVLYNVHVVQAVLYSLLCHQSDAKATFDTSWAEKGLQCIQIVTFLKFYFCWTSSSEKEPYRVTASAPPNWCGFGYVQHWLRAWGLGEILFTSWLPVTCSTMWTFIINTVKKHSFIRYFVTVSITSLVTAVTNEFLFSSACNEVTGSIGDLKNE